jgi:transposase
MSQYNINQFTLAIEIGFIPDSTDISHAINWLVESIPESFFDNYYKQYGRPAYNARMLMKVILCGYCMSAFSGRQIEDLVKDSKRMGWLAQGETPSYRTINRARINPILSEGIKGAYVELYCYLMDHELINGFAINIDGTKIEANANKFTFVWKKSIENYKAKMVQRGIELYDELLEAHIIPAIESEIGDNLDDEQIDQIIEKLDERVEDLTAQIDNEPNPAIRKELRKERTVPKKARKTFEDFKIRSEKYANDLEIMGDRNSYSKTDHDATFMRMKDDYMKNGQLKPGYNVQLATENQFALAVDIFPNPNDTRTLAPFLETIKNDYFGELPQFIIADAGYGSETNYIEVIEEQDRIPLIPYSTYEKEQKRRYKNDPFKPANWPYTEEKDRYICPDGRYVNFKRYQDRTDSFGYTRRLKVYECEDCSCCPVRSRCTRATSDKNRQIQINLSFEYFKAYTRQKLSDEDMMLLYKNRKIDVEPVFGHLKANLGFTRLHVRGADKVRSELRYAFMAVNMKKIAKMMKGVSAL